MMTEDDFKQLATELQQLQNFPPTEVPLSALEMFCIAAHLQECIMRAKNKDNPMTETAIDIAKMFQNSFNRNSAIYKALVEGWNWKEEEPTN